MRERDERQVRRRSSVELDQDASAARDRLVPGKLAATDGLEGRTPSHATHEALARALEELQRRIAELDRAIDARDAAAAVRTAALLRAAIGQARLHVVPERAVEIDTVVAQAESSIARAPQPSQAAMRSGAAGSWATWDREMAAWRSGRSATAGDADASSDELVGADPVLIAERGLADASEPLPHLDRLQPLFGRHDLSRIKAQVAGRAVAAARALGAKAFALGERIGFADAPDLELAAHEAVHVVDGRAGVARKAELDGGTSDPYEVRADAIAAAVARGERVEAQLDRAPASAGSIAVVHRKSDGGARPTGRHGALAEFLHIYEVDLRGAVVAWLRDAGWPDPAPEVRFAPGGERQFTASIVASVCAKLTDVDALRQLVSPGDLVERFHRHVDVSAANDPRPFGIALAQLVQWAARDALVERVGPRYRASWASRSVPPSAEELIGAHPMDAVIARALTIDGVVDLSEAPARDARKPGDHAKHPTPSVQQLMTIEHDIGTRLDAIRDQVAPLGLAGELRQTYDVRARRVALLADADAATRAHYLPVLQFQHAQLIAISAPLRDVVARYSPLRVVPELALSKDQRAERDELEKTVAAYVRAAATSHDERTSQALLRRIATQQVRDSFDAAQLDAEITTRDTVASTPVRAPLGNVGGRELVAQQRQAMLDGTPRGRSRYEQQIATTTAGEVALRARMQSAEYALVQLRAAAIETFGSEEGFGAKYPKLRRMPYVIQDVKDQLADVDRTWKAAIADKTPAVQNDPDAPDGWADWQGRTAALPVAQHAFATIAGDKDLAQFVDDARHEIHVEAIINAVVRLVGALVITVGVTFATAGLGTEIAAAFAVEEAGLALRAVAVAADLATSVTINTAVQLAIAQPTRRRHVDANGNEVDESDGAIAGTMLLENLLMDGFSRTLALPLRSAQKAALAEARELAALPHLTDAERSAVSAFSFAGTQVAVEVVGGMATQWAAHKLVELASAKGEEVSEPFALTVLQQGAAVALGKFFHGQQEAWHAHRDALAKTRIGQLAQAKALFDAREAFYARSGLLADSLSPDPTAMTELLQTNEALIKQEHVLFASAGPDPTPVAAAHTHTVGEPAHRVEGPSHATAEPTSATHPGASRTDTTDHLGHRIADETGARYLDEGRFEIDAPTGPITLEIRRTSGRPSVSVDGDHAIIEIPRALSGAEFERTVVARLAEVRDGARTDGAYEVTSAAVPGSSYKGKGDHRASEQQLLQQANAAIEDVAPAKTGVSGKVDRAHVDSDARPDLQVAAANTHVIHLGDNTSISVRVTVAPLEHQNVARSVMNPTKQGITRIDRENGVHVEHIKGRYVIQLSDKMEVVHVRRAVAHEVAEILARRELHEQNKLPGADILCAGGDVTAVLSPNDHGRIAEVIEVVRDIRSQDPSTHERARDELMALIEEMGLRQGVAGSDARFERMKPELTEAARAEVSSARARETAMTEAEQKRLAWTREEAARDRAERAAFDEAHKPQHQVPTTGIKGRIATPAERKELARKARAERDRRSAQTLAEIRTANASGRHPKMKLQIGGNAALAARDPHALLVDANQRWAIDRSKLLAQTAQQMEPIKAAGIGDPYEFAGAGDRVPLDALHYWQDSIAAQGPLVDGHAELGVAPDGTTLIATIHPNDGSPPVVVEPDGVPVVATGFTHENAPGARNKSPRQALNDVDKSLAGLSSDPQVGAMAQRARAEIANLHGQVETDAVKAIAALPGELRAKLSGMKDTAPALEILEASKSFAELRAKDPSHVFYGDEANQMSDEQIRGMRRVVIAGPGGTGISAAEIILSRNADAHVSMIGKDPPAGLAENDQFRAVVANFGTKELCTKLYVEPGRTEGRFEFQDGYYLGAAKLVDGKYDVSAQPAHAGTGPLAAEAAQGDTYITAMGRFSDVPPPVAALANQTEHAGGHVWQEALVDDDGLYAGYKVVIQQANGHEIVIDVTGAASRYADRTAMNPKDAAVVNKATEHDAPPESGIFDGSYAASGRQAARYRARRIVRGY